MIQDELIYQILQDFGFEPTHDQRNALQTFAQFMTDRRDNAVMIHVEVLELVKLRLLEPLFELLLGYASKCRC